MIIYSNFIKNIIDIPKNAKKFKYLIDRDTTAIYLPPGSIRFKICDCDASSQIPDYENIDFQLDQNNSIEYLPGYGTILNISNMPKKAVIPFKNVNFVIINMSDF